MMRIIHFRPTRRQRQLLGAVPLIVVAIIYECASYLTGAIPTLSMTISVLVHYLTNTADQEHMAPFWIDTFISLLRLALAFAIAIFLALLVGIPFGLIPIVRAALAPLTKGLSLVPAVALLPAILSLTKNDQISVQFILVFGLYPVLLVDVLTRMRTLPEQTLFLAENLGASTIAIMMRVALPLMLPHLMTSLRRALPFGWIILIAVEQSHAQMGLGHRLYAINGPMALECIMPYLIWMAILALVIDRTIGILVRELAPWSKTKEAP